MSFFDQFLQLWWPSLRKLPLSFPLGPVCHLSQLSWQQLEILKQGVISLRIGQYQWLSLDWCNIVGLLSLGGMRKKVKRDKPGPVERNGLGVINCFNLSSPAFQITFNQSPNVPKLSKINPIYPNLLTSLEIHQCLSKRQYLTNLIKPNKLNQPF